MGLYYNGKKVRNLYYNGKCLTRLALGKEMTRLVEGDDFVRAEWLKGDGTAYIDTLVDKLKGTITVDIDRTAVTSNSNILGREAYPGLGYESRCVVNLLRQNNNYIADIYGIRTTSGYGVNIDMMDTLYLDLVAKIASTKSGNSTSIDIGTDIGGYNMLLFAKNSGSAPSYCWSGSIGSFKMADVIDLTPCRLLRPIPATLDANGIARNAGECGMFDSVSGKFYGNVASSDAFTVEPSLVEGVDYERHRWLVGDGEAYIQVLGFVRNENWEITTSIANIQPTTHWILLYGYGYDAETGFNKAWTAFCDQNTTYIRLRRCDGTTYNDTALTTVQSVNTIIDGHNSVTINGETFSMTGRQYGQKPEFRIFSQFRDNLSTTVEKCSFSEFVVKENNLPILNLVPVRLLRSLPAYLDANGKARHQFECGMLDLKTMKFYGNGNTTGNFTVSDN